MTGNDRVKYATYWRDAESSLDYAMNRYYDNVTGRFLSPDPYGGSASAGNPQSWNKYAYVVGDPVGGNDPTGLDDAADGGDGGLSFNFNDFGGWGGYGGSSGSGDGSTGYSGPTPYNNGDVFISNVTTSATAPSGGSATNAGAGNSTGSSLVSYNSWTTTVSSGGVGSTSGPAAGGSPGKTSVPASPGTYGSYATCFVSGVLGHVINNSADVYGPAGLSVVTGLALGAKWGPAVALIGGIVATADFLVSENTIARSCSITNGYTPWVFSKR